MDTTAAAELGGGVVEGGVGYWDSGVEADGGWNEKGTAGQSASWGNGAGGGVGGSHGRGSRPVAENEPPFKRMKNMGGGEGPPYGSGSGNFNNNGSGSNAGHGGNAGGFGPGAGGSPSLKGYGSGGIGPSPGTPSGDSVAGSSQGQQAGASRGRGMGSIFYKTKLCSRFRNGNCPYNTNCNFAHGMEELRKPPPGWEDVVAAQEGGAGGAAAPSAATQPSVEGSNGGNGERTGGAGAGRGGGNAVGDGVNISDMQRFHKTRPCKKYFSELGCPYGDRCNFLHDEQTPQPKVPRESVVVTVACSAGASGSGGGGVGGVAGGTVNLRPPNWKTRLCNKWETTGNCPFGEKCHFAHGTAELQKYGGGPFDPTAEIGAGVQVDSKFGLNQSNNFLDGDDVFLSSFGDGYGQVMNVRQSATASIQQNSRLNHGPGVGYKSLGGWKGPTDRISTIYGDWVEEEEWEQSPAHVIKSAQQQVQSNQAYQEAADYPQSEIGPTRDRGGLSTSYGAWF
ncbi:hypothetical protein Mapa_009445 [Marchantia paleacea]|nr:hypothetical protein Mapa_009445 [Marchantia paleacea]